MLRDCVVIVHTWTTATFRGDVEFGRSRSEADIERFSVCTDRVAFDPKATWARRSPPPLGVHFVSLVCFDRP